MKTLVIERTGSTNTWVAENSSRLEAPCMVYALDQSAGRGQRGNSWESEHGNNITASALLVADGVEPLRQFVISEAVALAVTDLLGALGVEAAVKWPNDIYVADRKVCGILIEHSIMGRSITRTIAGIGVNINQETFRSDAPNPVSVKQLTGKDYPLEKVAAMLGSHIEERLAQISGGTIHEEFMKRLWRGDGKMYPFRDRKDGAMISARIEDIAEDGILSLRDEEGNLRKYAFKEVEFII